VSLLEGAIPILEEYLAAHKNDAGDVDPLNLAHIQLKYAQGLRMIGSAERALAILSSLKLDGNGRSFRQQGLLAIAMCKESLGVPDDEIVEAAEACRKVKPSSHTALHARHILVKHQSDTDKLTKLRNLHDEARKKNATVVANNIALDLVEGTQNVQQKDYLSLVINSGRSQNDHYNFVRALLKQIKLAQSCSSTVSRQQISDCVRAYSYLYNERIDTLFSKCHDVLWECFRSTNDQRNMLTLYRYSSLVWRLRGQSKTETKYREDLGRILGKQVASSILTVDRDLRYFLSRHVPSRPEISSATDVKNSSHQRTAGC
jgi:hypothetical protein